MAGYNEKALVRLIKAEKKGRIAWSKRDRVETITNGQWMVVSPVFKTLAVRVALFSIFGRDIEPGQTLVAIGGELQAPDIVLSGTPKYEPEYATNVGTLTPIRIGATGSNFPVQIIEGFYRLTAIDEEYADLPEQRSVYTNPGPTPEVLYFGDEKDVIISATYPGNISWEGLIRKHAQIQEWTDERYEPVQSINLQMVTYSPELYDKAKQLVIDEQHCSVSMIQRRLRVGYSVSARIINELEEEGVISEWRPNEERKVLISE